MAVPRRSRGGRRTLAALVLAVVLASPAAARVEEAPPEGYRVQAREQLVPGVDHLELRRDVDPQVVHVARMRPEADVALRVVLAEEGLGQVERTEAMCVRVHCIAAVNGDFYQPGTGDPIGGVVIDGQLLRSPVDSHHQLSVDADGVLSTGILEPAVRFVDSGLSELRLDGVNTERLEDQVILYTPARGEATGTNRFGTELTARIVEPAMPLVLGQTALVELVGLEERSGNARIPGDGLVLSGHGAGAQRLVELWAKAEAGDVGRRGLLRVEVNPLPAQSIGGSPILVRQGRRWVGDDGSGFVNGRHPRTIVGWTAAGDVLLVTVDGRQPGYSGGMTLPEAAELMLGLGAEEAINLDGGGSTTFVADGHVANQPSDRLVRRDGTERIVHVPGAGDTVVASVQRPVAVGLAIVRRSEPAASHTDALGAASPKLPIRVALRPPAGDTASVPGASFPAIVAILPGPPGRGLDLALATALSGALAAIGTAAVVRARWKRRLDRLLGDRPAGSQ